MKQLAMVSKFWNFRQARVKIFESGLIYFTHTFTVISKGILSLGLRQICQTWNEIIKEQIPYVFVSELSLINVIEYICLHSIVLNTIFPIANLKLNCRAELYILIKCKE